MILQREMSYELLELRSELWLPCPKSNFEEWIFILYSIIIGSCTISGLLESIWK
jgi:hypothetical protein